MEKEVADKLVDDLLESKHFTVSQITNPPGDTDMLGQSGAMSSVSVGSITLRHRQIKELIEIAEKHGCELYISSFHKAGDISIITKEEAKHLFPAHHKPPPMPHD